MWWSYGSERELAVACEGMLNALLAHGLPWFEEKSSREAFLAHAFERVERSRSPRHPEGRWAELRVFAATLAWNERTDEARRVAELAASLWHEESARLDAARARFARAARCDVAAIPNLQDDLVTLVTSPRELERRPHRRSGPSLK